MSKQCVQARARVYKSRWNIIIEVLKRGLPKPVKQILTEWGEMRKRVELWICEED